ncbi:alpha/beta hydrolase [Nocardia sp. NPDC048505]|uniref:alpha/beta fold hydrolase n=1 Tax=unclassified Nocardia TaxID=2637762 RepID=UPI0033DAE6E3
MTKIEALEHFTVDHDGVRIAVSRGGAGRLLVFAPGLTSTQAELHELLTLLRRDFEVVSFDLRGHGRSSAADHYSFAGFGRDLGAVLADLRRRGRDAAPILAGHSLGADLIVQHAAEAPGAAAELVLLDGANPLPEPFLTEADLPEFRAMWEEAAKWHALHSGTPRRVALTAAQILDLNRELDRIRLGLLDRYRRVRCPVHLIAATAMAGTEGRAPRHNRLWRSGYDRLLAAHPGIDVTWVDAGHGLVVTHAAAVADIVRSTLEPC